MENNVLQDPVKRKILDLTYYAFNQKGYKAVSMDLVSRELRISKKTIYKHFHSKEEILETAMLELFSEVEKRLAQFQKSSPIREVLMGFFETYKFFMGSFAPKLRAEIDLSMPHLADRVQNFERQVLHHKFSAWLKYHRKAGTIEYPSTTRALTGVVFEIMRSMADAPDDKARFLLLAMLKGMNTKKKKKK